MRLANLDDLTALLVAAGCDPVEAGRIEKAEIGCTRAGETVLVLKVTTFAVDENGKRFIVWSDGKHDAARNVRHIRLDTFEVELNPPQADEQAA